MSCKAVICNAGTCITFIRHRTLQMWCNWSLRSCLDAVTAAAVGQLCSRRRCRDYEPSTSRGRDLELGVPSALEEYTYPDTQTNYTMSQ